ncbi:MAG: CDP-alcohol phosphatidyltransferase family protein [Gemmatimonadetes bacterium]|nr:CDP-alcohol phosphatidyltransferase family protein [Gemmatimonadota bacterium]
MLNAIWLWIQRSYLRLIDPVADWLVAKGVSPNAITLFGTGCSVVGGVIYATGHITTAGLWLGITALFDVVDGMVARRAGKSTTFGAFFDSTLDRVADGAVMGGLAVFYASSPRHHSVTMVVVCVMAILGAFLTSYTRARAEALGVDAKVGMLQRPERVTLLAAPQGLFGLALDGWVLLAIVWLLAVTSWVTVWQRISYVAKVTAAMDQAEPGAVALKPMDTTVAEVTAHDPGARA